MLIYFFSCNTSAKGLASKNNSKSIQCSLINEDYKQIKEKFLNINNLVTNRFWAKNFSNLTLNSPCSVDLSQILQEKKFTDVVFETDDIKRRFRKITYLQKINLKKRVLSLEKLI